MAEKRPGEIAQIEMFNPTCKLAGRGFMTEIKTICTGTPLLRYAICIYIRLKYF